MIRRPMTVEEIERFLKKNESKEVMALCKTNKKSIVDIKWLYKTDPVFGTAGGAEVRLNGKLLFMHIPNPCKLYEDWTDKEIFYEILERLGYEVDWEEESVYYEDLRKKMNKYLSFLKYIDQNNPKLQADFCRENAKLIAEAASRGHITAINYYSEATNYWRLTCKAYAILKACE